MAEMKTYTDEQIVKSLENIRSEKIGDCKRGCAFYDGKVHSCEQTIALHALELIKRQQVDKENLKIKLQAMRGAANSFKSRVKTLEMDNAQLHSDIINANQNFDHVKRLWEAEKEKVEKAKQKVINICKELQKSKAEIKDLTADKEALINGQLTLQKMYLESRAKAVMELAEIIIADYPEMEYYLKDIIKETTEEQTNPT